MPSSTIAPAVLNCDLDTLFRRLAQSCQVCKHTYAFQNKGLALCLLPKTQQLRQKGAQKAKAQPPHAARPRQASSMLSSLPATIAPAVLNCDLDTLFRRQVQSCQVCKHTYAFQNKGLALCLMPKTQQLRQKGEWQAKVYASPAATGSLNSCRTPAPTSAPATPHPPSAPAAGTVDTSGRPAPRAAPA
jgi:ribosomal protein L37E